MRKHYAAQLFDGRACRFAFYPIEFEDRGSEEENVSLARELFKHFEPGLIIKNIREYTKKY